MALEGIEKESGRRIKLWDMTESQILDVINRIKDDGLEVTCQYEQCGCRMHVKALGSEYVIAHFARYPKTGKNAYHQTGGEGQKHLLAKAVLARQLKVLHPEAEIITEYRVEGDMPHKSSRRIDVYMELPDGETEAHEIQISYQTYSDTIRRTRDLQAYGIGEVVWWWDTDDRGAYANIEWCIDNLPRHGLIKFKHEKIMGKRAATPVEAVFYFKNNAEIIDYRRRKEEDRLEKIEAEMKRVKREPPLSYLLRKPKQPEPIRKRIPLVRETIENYYESEEYKQLCADMRREWENR